MGEGIIQICFSTLAEAAVSYAPRPVRLLEIGISLPILVSKDIT